MPEFNRAALLRRTTGVYKDAGGSLNLQDVNFSGLIPIPDVLDMIVLTRNHSAWLGEIGVRTVKRSTGKIPIFNLNEPVMEYVGEQDPESRTTRPPTTQVEYQTRKHRCDIVISHEELDESAAIDTDFEKTVLDNFTIQLENDVANAAWNGDRSLSALNRQNKALRGIDGIEKLSSAGANVTNCNGKLFGDGAFDAVRDSMPKQFRNDKSGLRWMINDRIYNRYQKLIGDRLTVLGDQAKISATIQNPLGVPPVLVPHIDEEVGPTAIAPTSVVNNTTYLTFNLTTLVTAGDPASVTDGVGRKFRVKCKTTGYDALCWGYNDSGTLKIATSDLLGQTDSVSTTASDYEVSPADETSILYGNPKMITLIWNKEWRIYREYNAKLDQVEITIYMEFTVAVPVPQAIVKFTNIAAPPILWSTAA